MPIKHVDLTPDQIFEARLAALRQRCEDQERATQHWQAKYEQKAADFDALAALKEPIEHSPLTIPSRSTREEGIMCAILSDWHVAEIVDRKKVHGLNRYTPEIAAERARRATCSMVKVHRHWRESYNVDKVLLFLGGDFITGWIHEELAQTNAMPPMQEARFARQLLRESIATLAAEKTIKHLRIVCQRGNHARMTKKMQFKNDFETSWETFIYLDLQEQFHDGKRIIVDVPRSDVHHIELVPGYRCRMYHGHQVRYKDGVGGLTIPLNKWQHKCDKTLKARVNLMGHWHCYSLPNASTILNGSTKGWDELCASFGIPFQEPLQAAALFDTRRKMMAQHLPIFCT